MDGGSWHCTGGSDQDDPQEKEMQKGKMVVWGALKIAEKRREAKGKGEKEWYTHVNAKFQRTAWRDKKTFLSDQSKEIEENNRMEKTGDLFKKIRDTKGILLWKPRQHIKKRWQEYTEELYKKDLHNPDNHDGVITLLEPDILECEVKWP